MSGPAQIFRFCGRNSDGSTDFWTTPAAFRRLPDRLEAADRVASLVAGSRMPGHENTLSSIVETLVQRRQFGALEREFFDALGKRLR